MKYLPPFVPALLVLGTFICLIAACRSEDLPSPLNKQEVAPDWLLSEVLVDDSLPRSEFTYNEFNKPVLFKYSTKYRPDFAPFIVEIDTLLYNTQHQLIEMRPIYCSEPGYLGKPAYFYYDAQGRLKDIFAYRIDGVRADSISYTYVNDTLVTSMTYRNNYGGRTDTFQHRYTYDNAGNLRTLYLNSTSSGTYYYGYDQRPNPLKLTNLNIDLEDIHYATSFLLGDGALNVNGPLLSTNNLGYGGRFSIANGDTTYLDDISTYERSYNSEGFLKKKNSYTAGDIFNRRTTEYKYIQAK